MFTTHTKKYGHTWIVLSAIMLVTGLLRLRLLSFPLERDEGEYAYIGQMILEGIFPYREAYTMKLPGTHIVYALFMAVFGKTTEGIHLGLLITSLSTILFLYFLTKQILNSYAALFAASTYGIISVSQHVLGFAGHATHFVVFFMTVGFYFFLSGLDKKKAALLFFSGIMFGISFLTKQSSVFFILSAGFYFLYQQSTHRTFEVKKMLFVCGIFVIGVSLPYLAIFSIVLVQGSFDNFWFWTVQYAWKYQTLVNFQNAILLFRANFNPVFREFICLWIGALLSTVFLFKITGKDRFILIFLFVLSSILATSSGLFFRQHYFIQCLPALSLLIGAGMSFFTDVLIKKGLNTKLAIYISVSLFALAAGNTLAINKDYFFAEAPQVLSRKVYGLNPFPESVNIAEFIKSQSAINDKLAILGSEPQILFYAGRKSATGFLYTYSLMENHSYSRQLQEKMISEIEKGKPDIIVFCKINSSWGLRYDSLPMIFEWFNMYIEDHYSLIEVVDIQSNNLTQYKMFDEAKTYISKSSQVVFVFKRLR